MHCSDRRVIAASLAAATLVAGPGDAFAGVQARAATPRSHTCRPVRVHHRRASAIHTNLACPRARRLLRRWLHRRRLPRDQFGWYCAGARSVTCGGGNGGNAPYVRFRYRR